MMLRKTTLVFLLFLVLSSHMIVPPRVAVARSIHKESEVRRQDCLNWRPTECTFPGGSNIKEKVVRKIDATGSPPRKDGAGHR
ncbi:hypothetical protein BT93_L3074 [Corymbia citriodora subsp. variegata]|uniref:Uncharacterized protein n=1 Tax=Corymbia citriodora subsp. variegata TaxID=360336 RepID=A0A8T0CMG7_CORYI|nr:hypothetical protein BT93_L3074 [Corymbia citriodora subsp. variegata]